MKIGDLKVGDLVTLSSEREYEVVGFDGWDAKISASFLRESGIDYIKVPTHSFTSARKPMEVVFVPGIGNVTLKPRAGVR